MLFVSLIPFVFTLFISLLFKIARALVCWTLHDGRRASGKHSSQPVLSSSCAELERCRMQTFILMSSLVVTLVTVCFQLVLSGLTATREHIMSLWSGLLKNSGQQCCAK